MLSQGKLLPYRQFLSILLPSAFLLTPCILHEVRRERTLPAFRVCVLASAHGALALPLPCR